MAKSKARSTTPLLPTAGRNGAPSSEVIGPGPQAQDLSREFPIMKRGAKRKLTPQARFVACKAIGELLASGVTLSDSQTRIARRFDVSKRSIERAWQERKQLAAAPAEPEIGFDVVLAWVKQNFVTASPTIPVKEKLALVAGMVPVPDGDLPD